MGKRSGTVWSFCRGRCLPGLLAWLLPLGLGCESRQQVLQTQFGAGGAGFDDGFFVGGAGAGGLDSVSGGGPAGFGGAGGLGGAGGFGGFGGAGGTGAAAGSSDARMSGGVAGLDLSDRPSAMACTVDQLPDVAGALVAASPLPDARPVHWELDGGCIPMTIAPEVAASQASVSAAAQQWRMGCSEFCFDITIGPDPGLETGSHAVHVRFGQPAQEASIAQTELFFELDTGVAQFAYITLRDTPGLVLTLDEWALLLGEAQALAPGSGQPSETAWQAMCELYGPGSPCQDIVGGD